MNTEQMQTQGQQSNQNNGAANGSAPAQPSNPTLLNPAAIQGQPANDWRTSLDSDLQTIVTAKGWKNPQDAIKSYTELERKIGSASDKKVIVPKDGASEQEWNAYYEKLGRPQKSDDYQLSRAKEFDFYDEKATSEFKQIAHKAGLTAKQAQIVHDEFYAYENKIYAEQRATQEANTEEVRQTLNREWGAAYSDNIKIAEVAAKELFGGNNELVEALHGVMGEKFYKMLHGYAKNTMDPKIVTGRDSGWAKSPEDAKREIDRLKGDGEFQAKLRNKSHPEQRAAQDEYDRLYAQAYPSN